MKIPHTPRASALVSSLALLAATLALPAPAGAFTILDRNAINPVGVMTQACAGLGGLPTQDAGYFGPWDNVPQSNCNGAAIKVGYPVLNQSAHSHYDVTFFKVTTTQVADAYAQAGYGWVKTSANATGVGGAGDLAAGAMGGWSDLLTINPLDPAQIGAPGQLLFNVHVEGFLKRSIGGGVDGPFTQFQLTAYRNDLLPQESLQNFNWKLDVGDPATTLSLNTNVQMAVPFVFGTAFRLAVFGRSFAEVWTPLSFPMESADSEFGHTMTWQGISGVTLGGNAVAYSLSSASGIDWTHAINAPVPEPSGSWLMLAGLAFGAWRLRRR